MIIIMEAAALYVYSEKAAAEPPRCLYNLENY